MITNPQMTQIYTDFLQEKEIPGLVPAGDNTNTVFFTKIRVSSGKS